MIERELSALILSVRAEENMHSQRPKPLHMLCGRPMGSYVLDTLAKAGVKQCAVVTQADGVRISKRLSEESPDINLRFVEVAEVSGHGEAALLGLSDLEDIGEEEDLIITTADMPLLRTETVEELVSIHRNSGSACTAIGFRCNDISEIKNWPTADIVVRDKNDRVIEIVDPEYAESVGLLNVPEFELALGLYIVKKDLVSAAIRRAEPQTGDTQIRDIAKVLSSSGNLCTIVQTTDMNEIAPIENRVQLASAEAELRHRINENWLRAGVTMVDPDHTYIDSTVVLGEDVTLFSGTVLKGKTVIGDGCSVGPDVKLETSTLGQETVVEFSVIQGSSVGSDCKVGPYAVLVPGSEIEDGTITGAFYNK